jgi:hypothetical protein
MTGMSAAGVARHARPGRGDRPSRDGQFLGDLTDRCQGGRWQAV